MAEVRLQEGESLENALRRFKRKVQTEDIIKVQTEDIIKEVRTRGERVVSSWSGPLLTFKSYFPGSCLNQ